VTSVQILTPTDRWLGATADYMPPLDGPAGTAERLLLLVHYGVDWQNGWVSRYRKTYWAQLLPDRIITSTYRTGTLRRWWRDVADELGSQPAARPSEPSWSGCCAQTPSQCSRSSGSRPKPCCCVPGSSPRPSAPPEPATIEGLTHVEHHQLVWDPHRDLLDRSRRRNPWHHHAPAPRTRRSTRRPPSPPTHHQRQQPPRTSPTYR